MGHTRSLVDRTESGQVFDSILLRERWMMASVSA